MSNSSRRSQITAVDGQSVFSHQRRSLLKSSSTRSASQEDILYRARVVQRGSFGFWALQAVSTFTLPLVDDNARHSERVNDDAQLASAQSTLSSTQRRANSTSVKATAPRQDGASAGRLGDSGGLVRRRVGAHRPTAIQGRVSRRSTTAPQAQQAATQPSTTPSRLA